MVLDILKSASAQVGAAARTTRWISGLVFTILIGSAVVFAVAVVIAGIAVGQVTNPSWVAPVISLFVVALILVWIWLLWRLWDAIAFSLLLLELASLPENQMKFALQKVQGYLKSYTWSIGVPCLGEAIPDLSRLPEEVDRINSSEGGWYGTFEGVQDKMSLDNLVNELEKAVQGVTGVLTGQLDRLLMWFPLIFAVVAVVFAVLAATSSAVPTWLFITAVIVAVLCCFNFLILAGINLCFLRPLVEHTVGGRVTAYAKELRQTVESKFQMGSKGEVKSV